jgi:hypothetical protein
VGAALTPRLLAALPDHEIVVASRFPERVRFATGIYADLRAPRLGLDRPSIAALQRRIRIIVHAGADTRFRLPLEEARLVNATGTRRMLDFALGCTNLEQFAHLSTLYIAGRRSGYVREELVSHGCGYFNFYEQSKHEAEAIVAGEFRRLPASIYRLSSVVSETGRRGHVQQVLRLLPQSADFPVLPVLPGSPVDLIGSEWAAAAIARLLLLPTPAGSVHHVCAGPERAIAADELVNRAHTWYEERLARPLPRPRLVSLLEFHALLAEQPPTARAGEVLLALATFLPHLALSQPFEASSLLEPEPSISVLLRALEYEFSAYEIR